MTDNMLVVSVDGQSVECGLQTTLYIDGQRSLSVDFVRRVGRLYNKVIQSIDVDGNKFLPVNGQWSDGKGLTVNMSTTTRPSTDGSKVIDNGCVLSTFLTGFITVKSSDNKSAYIDKKNALEKSITDLTKSLTVNGLDPFVSNVLNAQLTSARDSLKTLETNHNKGLKLQSTRKLGKKKNSKSK